MASKFDYIVGVGILTILGVQRRPLSVKVFLKFEAFCSRDVALFILTCGGKRVGDGV